MHWITLAGTIAFGAVLILAVLAMVDILFLKPASRTQKSRSPDKANAAHASLYKGMRRRPFADKKN